MFISYCLSMLLSYVLESSIELGILYMIVKAVLRLKRLDNPSARSRFLLIPLIIRALISPAIHFIFPLEDHLAIRMQIEDVLPNLSSLHSSFEHWVAPVILIAFLSLLAYNALVALATNLHQAHADFHLADVRWQRTLRRLAKSFGLTQQPVLSISTRCPTSTYTSGWQHPIITVGEECVKRLKTEEMKAVLAHELAHIKRGDNWQILLAKTCRDLMFFNPMAQLLYNEYETAREQAADDLALQITHKPLALASSLLKFCQMQQVSKSPALGPAFLVSRNRIGDRILRLVNYREDYESVQAHNVLFFSLAVALAIIFSLI